MSYYCTNPLGDYTQNTCDETYAGGNRQIVIFEDELPVDPSDGVEVLSLINEGKAKLISDIKIGIPLPSAITQARYRSCSPETVVIYDRTLTLMDDNVLAANVDFYNSLNASFGTEVAGALVYQCDADRCSFINKPMSFEGGLVHPDDNTDLQHWEFTGKWKDKGDAEIVATPAGVFN